MRIFMATEKTPVTIKITNKLVSKINLKLMKYQ